MAIELNSAALNVYRNAAFADGKTIINNDGDGIKANGVYTGALSALTRSTEEKAANNAARSQLLRSLGRAFNVKGMTETDGKVTFSREFMTRLEKILGADFKRGDFGINADGEVTSGKPLTMRRVQAIVKKADLVGNGSFNIPVYEEKLAVIKQALGYGKLSTEDLQKLPSSDARARSFVLASKILDFLKNEAEKTVIVSEAYLFARDCGEEEEAAFNGGKYAYFDAMKNEYVDFSHESDYHAYIERRIGAIMHLEFSNFDRNRTETIGKLKDYATGILQLFLKRFVDNYFSAKAEGKVDAYFDYLDKHPGVCLEDKCQKLEEFEAKHLMQSEAMSIAEAAEIKRIADTAVNGGRPAGVNILVYDVIEQLYTDDPVLAESDNWADFAAKVKDILVGRKAAITHPEVKDDRYEFPPVMENGKVVVRALTEEDIDRVGPACIANIYGIL